MKPSTNPAPDCRVCGIEHDDELHQAILNVRAYLREWMELVCRPLEIGERMARSRPKPQNL